MAGKFLKRPASNLFFQADTLSKRHTSTSDTMHVKDDNEKRHYDIERVPCCRSDVGGDERNGVVLRDAPGSPAAVRRPRLSIRGRTFVALLGPAIEEGIAGFGDSVQAALRAFDAQYSRSLMPPADRD
jgi:hypothetical protein